MKNLLAAAAEGHGRGGHVTLGIVAIEAMAQDFGHGGLTGAAYGGMGAAALYTTNSMRQAGIGDRPVRAGAGQAGSSAS